MELTCELHFDMGCGFSSGGIGGQHITVSLDEPGQFLARHPEQRNAALVSGGNAVRANEMHDAVSRFQSDPAVRRKDRTLPGGVCVQFQSHLSSPVLPVLVRLIAAPTRDFLTGARKLGVLSRPTVAKELPHKSHR